MYDDLDPDGDLLDPAYTPAYTPGDIGAIPFRRVRDVGSVINVTFRFLRENLEEFGRALLTVLGPVVLVVAIVNYFVQVRMLEAFASIGSPDPADPFALFEGYFSGPFLLVALLSVLAPLLLTALTYAYVDLYRRGEAGAIPPGRLWGEAQGLVLPYFGYAVLAALVFAVTGLVVIIPCLGLLVWFAFLVYAWPILSLLFVARALEGEGLADGLARVRRLVKGAWWPTAGVLFIAGLIVFVANIVLSLPAQLAGFGFGFMSLNPEPPSGFDRALLAVGALVSTLIYAAYPIYLVAAAFQYGSLVEEAEGTELHARVDRLAGASRPERGRSEPAGPGPDAPSSPPVSWRDGAGDTPSPPSPPPPPDGGSQGFRGGGYDDAERS